MIKSIEIQVPFFEVGDHLNKPVHIFNDHLFDNFFLPFWNRFFSNFVDPFAFEEYFWKDLTHFGQAAAKLGENQLRGFFFRRGKESWELFELFRKIFVGSLHSNNIHTQLSVFWVGNAVWLIWSARNLSLINTQRLIFLNWLAKVKLV